MTSTKFLRTKCKNAITNYTVVVEISPCSIGNKEHDTLLYNNQSQAIASIYNKALTCLIDTILRKG